MLEGLWDLWICFMVVVSGCFEVFFHTSSSPFELVDLVTLPLLHLHSLLNFLIVLFKNVKDYGMCCLK